MNAPVLRSISRIMRSLAATVFLLVLTIDAASAQSFVRLQNRYTEDYVHVERGFPEHGQIREGWFSAMWTLETVPRTGFYRIRNRYTDTYLHVEGGPLQVGNIRDGWLSAMWALDTVPGTSFYRIRNRYTDQYLHVEYGPLQEGDIEPGWWSAMWTLSSAEPCDTVQYEAGPIWNDDDAKVKCPATCAGADGTWNGQWRTTIPGKMSICECSVC